MIKYIDKTKQLTLTYLHLITVNRQKPLHLTVNRQNRQNFTVNRQSYTPIETLLSECEVRSLTFLVEQKCSDW